MTSFDDKLKGFICYLKNYHKNRGINWMGKDLDLLDAIRLDPHGKECYSKESERQVIMEHDTNESIHNALETLKDITHLEEIENKIEEKYGNYLSPITIKNNEKIIKILDKLRGLGVIITVKKLDNVILKVCSVFYLWVINGEKYSIVELAPGEFKIETEKWCPACLLDDTLKKYSTIGGWAPLTNTNTADENGSLKNFSHMISDYLSSELERLLGKNLEEKVLAKCKRITGSLIDLIVTYLIGVSLISCWVYGKEIYAKRDPFIELK